MEPFTSAHRHGRRRCGGRNVDTDQIIPAVYLKRVTRRDSRTGCSPHGAATRTSCCNRPEYAGASVLVAGPDFGTGLLSRARRVGAAGLRVQGRPVPRFADIFRGNAGQGRAGHGLRRAADVERIWHAVEADPSTEVTVDLESRTVTWAGESAPLRHRRLHELAADGGSRRRRPDPPARRRGGRLRVRRPRWMPTTA